MNETLQGFFILCTLILWTLRSRLSATICFALALASKESAIIVLLLLPLIELFQGRSISLRNYALLAIPTAIFTAVLAGTWSRNFMVSNHSYELSGFAIVILLKNIHRLLWPWIYIGIIVFRIAYKSWPSRRTIAAFLICGLPMLPYIFVAYSTNLPSRQVYLASALFMALLAVLLRPVWQTRLGVAFVSIFLAFNIVYLRKKDRGFQERGAPTSVFLQIIREQRPQALRVEGLDYPQLWAVRASTLSVPGWEPELISSSLITPDCAGCLELRWNPVALRYDEPVRPFE
jgi:hypothetical protein